MQLTRDQRYDAGQGYAKDPGLLSIGIHFYILRLLTGASRDIIRLKVSASTRLVTPQCILMRWSICWLSSGALSATRLDSLMKRCVFTWHATRRRV
jgi:hypothetical protein